MPFGGKNFSSYDSGDIAALRKILEPMGFRVVVGDNTAISSQSPRRMKVMDVNTGSEIPIDFGVVRNVEHPFINASTGEREKVYTIGGSGELNKYPQFLGPKPIVQWDAGKNNIELIGYSAFERLALALTQSREDHIQNPNQSQSQSFYRVLQEDVTSSFPYDYPSSTLAAYHGAPESAWMQKIRGAPVQFTSKTPGANLFPAQKIRAAKMAGEALAQNAGNWGPWTLDSMRYTAFNKDFDALVPVTKQIIYTGRSEDRVYGKAELLGGLKGAFKTVGEAPINKVDLFKKITDATGVSRSEMVKASPLIYSTNQVYGLATAGKANEEPSTGLNLPYEIAPLFLGGGAIYHEYPAAQKLFDYTGKVSTPTSSPLPIKSIYDLMPGGPTQINLAAGYQRTYSSGRTTMTPGHLVTGETNLPIEISKGEMPFEAQTAFLRIPKYVNKASGEWAEGPGPGVISTRKFIKPIQKAQGGIEVVADAIKQTQLGVRGIIQMPSSARMEDVKIGTGWPTGAEYSVEGMKIARTTAEVKGGKVAQAFSETLNWPQWQKLIGITKAPKFINWFNQRFQPQEGKAPYVNIDELGDKWRELSDPSYNFSGSGFIVGILGGLMDQARTDPIRNDELTRDFGLRHLGPHNIPLAPVNPGTWNGVINDQIRGAQDTLGISKEQARALVERDFTRQPNPEGGEMLGFQHVEESWVLPIHEQRMGNVESESVVREDMAMNMNATDPDWAQRMGYAPGSLQNTSSTTQALKHMSTWLSLAKSAQVGKLDQLPTETNVIGEKQLYALRALQLNRKGLSDRQFLEKVATVVNDRPGIMNSIGGMPFPSINSALGLAFEPFGEESGVEIDPGGRNMAKSISNLVEQALPGANQTLPFADRANVAMSPLFNQWNRIFSGKGNAPKNVNIQQSVGIAGNASALGGIGPTDVYGQENQINAMARELGVGGRKEYKSLLQMIDRGQVSMYLNRWPMNQLGNLLPGILQGPSQFRAIYGAERAGKINRNPFLRGQVMVGTSGIARLQNADWDADYIATYAGLKRTEEGINPVFSSLALQTRRPADMEYLLEAAEKKMFGPLANMLNSQVKSSIYGGDPLANALEKGEHVPLSDIGEQAFNLYSHRAFLGKEYNATMRDLFAGGSFAKNISEREAYALTSSNAVSYNLDLDAMMASGGTPLEAAMSSAYFALDKKTNEPYFHYSTNVYSEFVPRSGPHEGQTVPFFEHRDVPLKTLYEGGLQQIYEDIGDYATRSVKIGDKDYYLKNPEQIASIIGNNPQQRERLTALLAAEKDPSKHGGIVQQFIGNEMFTTDFYRDVTLAGQTARGLKSQEMISGNPFLMGMLGRGTAKMGSFAGSAEAGAAFHGTLSPELSGAMRGTGTLQRLYRRENVPAHELESAGVYANPNSPGGKFVSTLLANAGLAPMATGQSEASAQEIASVAEIKAWKSGSQEDWNAAAMAAARIELPAIPDKLNPTDPSVYGPDDGIDHRKLIYFHHWYLPPADYEGALAAKNSTGGSANWGSALAGALSAAVGGNRGGGGRGSSSSAGAPAPASAGAPAPAPAGAPAPAPAGAPAPAPAGAGGGGGNRNPPPPVAPPPPPPSPPPGSGGGGPGYFPPPLWKQQRMVAAALYNYDRFTEMEPDIEAAWTSSMDAAGIPANANFANRLKEFKKSPGFPLALQRGEGADALTLAKQVGQMGQAIPFLNRFAPNLQTANEIRHVVQGPTGAVWSQFEGMVKESSDKDRRHDQVVRDKTARAYARYEEGTPTGQLIEKATGQLETLGMQRTSIFNSAAGDPKALEFLQKYEDAIEAVSRATQAAIPNEKERAKVIDRASKDAAFASSQLGKILGIDTSIDTIDKKIKALTTAREHFESGQVTTQDLEAVGSGLTGGGGSGGKSGWGGLARRALGGFGLMYLRSIYGLATEGIGWGAQEAEQMQGTMQGVFGQQLGRSSVYAGLSQKAEIATALAGGGMTAKNATQLWQASHPTLRGLGQAAISGVAVAGATSWLGSMVPEIGEIGLGVLAPIALGAAAVSYGLDIQGLAQDPNSVAWRLSKAGVTSAWKGDSAGTGISLAQMAKDFTAYESIFHMTPAQLATTHQQLALANAVRGQTVPYKQLVQQYGAVSAGTVLAKSYLEGQTPLIANEQAAAQTTAFYTNYAGAGFNAYNPTAVQTMGAYYAYGVDLAGIYGGAQAAFGAGAGGQFGVDKSGNITPTSAAGSAPSWVLSAAERAKTVSGPQAQALNLGVQRLQALPTAQFMARPQNDLAMDAFAYRLAALTTPQFSMTQAGQQRWMAQAQLGGTASMPSVFQYENVNVSPAQVGTAQAQAAGWQSLETRRQNLIAGFTQIAAISGNKQFEANIAAAFGGGIAAAATASPASQAMTDKTNAAIAAAVPTSSMLDRSTRSTAPQSAAALATAAEARRQMQNAIPGVQSTSGYYSGYFEPERPDKGERDNQPYGLTNIQWTSPAARVSSEYARTPTPPVTVAPQGAAQISPKYYSMLEGMLNRNPVMLNLGAQLSGYDASGSLEQVTGGTMPAWQAMMADRNITTGALTGLPWGTTSIGSGVKGGPNAQQMATKMFGADWQNSYTARNITTGVDIPGFGRVGGERGQQYGAIQQQWGFAQAQAGLSMAQVNMQQAFQTGVGIQNYSGTINPQTGTPFGFNTGNFGFNVSVPGQGAYSYQSQGGGAWGLADAQRYLGYAQTQSGFQFQQRGLDIQTTQFGQNMALQAQGMALTRAQGTEQFQYAQGMSAQQFGFGQMMFREQARFTSGRERRLSEMQNTENVTVYGMEKEQREKEFGFQKQGWDLQTKQFQLQIKQFTETKKLQQDQLDTSIKFFEEQKKLQEESVKMDRAQQTMQIQYQKESIGLQLAMAAAAKDTSEKLLEMQLQSDLTNGAISLLADDALQKLYDKTLAYLTLIANSLGITLPGIHDPNDTGNQVGGHAGALPGSGDGLFHQLAMGGMLGPGDTVGEWGPERVVRMGNGLGVLPAGTGRGIIGTSGFATGSLSSYMGHTVVNYKGSGVGQPQQINIFIGNEKLASFVIDAVNKDLRA